MPKGLSLVVHGLCRENKLPEPQDEFYFAKPRRWRFDHAWPPCLRDDHVHHPWCYRRTAMEVEGGVWVVGRHVRGGGYVKDLEKYNAAALRGWRLVRYTPAQIKAGAWVSDLRLLLGVTG